MSQIRTVLGYRRRMDGELTAGAIAGRTFGGALRGYDRDEVDAFRREVVTRLEALEAELAEAQGKLNQLGIAEVPRLSEELGRVGQDISAILAEAQRAATEMRQRAAADAASWRTEAAAAATAIRRSAQEDAERMRGDAWAEGTALLGSAQEGAERIVAGGRQDVLFIRAEAEREVLRLTGEARREAEDLLRNARAESDRLVAAADAEAEEAVAVAQRSMQGTLERAKTLEARRTELLAEIEVLQRKIEELRPKGVEAQRVVHPGEEPPEQTWEQPDEDGGAVRIVASVPPSLSSPVDADELAAEVERMRSERLVAEPPTVPPARDHGAAPPTPAPQPESPPPAGVEVSSADRTAMAADATPQPLAGEVEESVATAHHAEPAEVDATEPDETDVASEETVAPRESALAAESEPAEEAAESEVEAFAAGSEPTGASAESDVVAVAVEPEDALEDLFARLRLPTDQPQDEPPADAQAAAETAAVAPVATEAAEAAQPPPQDDEKPEPRQPVPALAEATPPGEGAFELRDRLLVPIENEALRAVKRRVLDLQNRVLEGLRTSPDGWQPDGDEFAAVLADDVDAMGGRAYAAGVSAAAQLTAHPNVDVAAATPTGASSGLADALHAAVVAAHEHAVAHAAGSRETAAAVSRVFRAWRTDEAERRLRFAAYHAYHQGMLAGLSAAGVAAVTAVTLGRPCAECPAGSEWAPGGSLPSGAALPPVHLECATTIVPAGMAG